MIAKPFILHYLVITLSEYGQFFSIQLAKHSVSVGTKAGSIRPLRRFTLSVSSSHLQAYALHITILLTFTVPSGVLRMTSSGITKASVEKALAHVNETDMESLVAFVQQLKKIVADEGDKGRVVSCSSLKTREVFELFSLSNKYTDFGSYRKYDIPEIELSHSQRCPGLKPSAHELLRSIATIWPQSNESNVRVFVSLLIHFSVEQINSEMDLNAGSEASSSSDRVNIPSPSPKVAPVTPPRNIQSPLKSSFPVTLKAYTEALVSWETKDELDRKILVRGFIDYGISYAQKTPESLETFFAIAETKAAGTLSENSWAQLLCYMGWYLSCAMVHY